MGKLKLAGGCGRVADQDNIPGVTKGVALAGAVRFNMNGNVTNTYKGPVLISRSETVTAILKDIPIEELAKEMFIAVLGRSLNLPIPRPLLVAADNDIIPASSAPTHNSRHVLFGSELVGTPSLGQICVNGQTDRVVKELLKRWKTAGQGYSFDTWTANIDRHIHNIMFDGVSDVWLIDHGRTFNKPDGLPPDATGAAIPSVNRMDQWLINRLDDNDKSGFASSIANLTHNAMNIALESVASACILPKLIGDNKQKVMIDYLSNRIKFTNSLAGNSSGLSVPLV